MPHNNLKKGLCWAKIVKIDCTFKNVEKYMLNGSSDPLPLLPQTSNFAPMENCIKMRKQIGSGEKVTFLEPCIIFLPL